MSLSFPRYTVEILKVPEGIECSNVGDAFGTVALYDTQNRVAVIIINLTPSSSSEPLKAWRDGLKRHSDVLAARSTCLSNQCKRQSPVINTQTPHQLLHLAFQRGGGEVGRVGLGNRWLGPQKEPSPSAGAALSSPPGST